MGQALAMYWLANNLCPQGVYKLTEEKEIF